VSDELNRLRWRCQRGMLELDHILVRFLERDYPAAGPELQQAFADLLAMEDPDILDRVMARCLPDSPGQAALLARLRGTGPE
jgi:antitoxin CptB